jgi:hypothetical protein
MFHTPAPSALSLLIAAWVRPCLLQSLNPLPYIAMWANCVAWLVYAFLITDPYVLASNVPGVLIASYMAVSCYGYADEKVRHARGCLDPLVLCMWHDHRSCQSTAAQHA